MKFEIKSKGIINGIIQDVYGSKNNDKINNIPQYSLPLEWTGMPNNTVSYVIVFIDYDNCEEEGFPWIHWTIANIPAEIVFIPSDASRDIKTIDKKIVQGKNTWISQIAPENIECNRYGGPAPEKGEHEYEIRIYAMDSFLEIEDGFYYNELLKKMRGRIIDETAVYGSYRCVK